MKDISFLNAKKFILEFKIKKSFSKENCQKLVESLKIIWKNELFHKLYELMNIRGKINDFVDIEYNKC